MHYVIVRFRLKETRVGCGGEVPRINACSAFSNILLSDTSVPDPDPPGSELFGLKDLDPKLLITDPDPSLFHTILRNMF